MNTNGVNILERVNQGVNPISRILSQHLGFRHHSKVSVLSVVLGRVPTGFETTPEAYVQHTIEILREIRRVLRHDGVVFWNIGDSYNSGSVGREDKHKYGGKSRIQDLRSGVRNHPVLKLKDLCLIPFRVAIAAQEDGWWEGQL